MLYTPIWVSQLLKSFYFWSGLAVVVILILSPYLVLSNTDSFYWIWMARRPDQWWLWMQDQGGLLVKWHYPQVFGFLLYPFYLLTNLPTYSTPWIAVFTALSVVFVLWTFRRLLKRSPDYQGWHTLWVGLVLLSDYWLASFIVGGDLSPRLIGLGLMLWAVELIVYAPVTFKNILGTLVVLGSIYWLHSPELLYLFSALLIYIVLFRRSMLRTHLHLWPGLLFAMYALGGFLLRMWNVIPTTMTGQYTYPIFSPLDWFPHYLYIAVVLAWIGFGMVLQTKKFQPLALFFVTLLLLLAAILVFPEEWAMATKARWSWYRNLIYLNFPIAYLSLLGLITLNSLKNIKPTLRVIGLVMIILIQGFVTTLTLAKIVMTRMWIPPQPLVEVLPSGMQTQFEIIAKDQSFYKNTLVFLNQVDDHLQSDTNGLVLTQNHDLSLYAGSILWGKNRDIWFAAYPEVAFVFAYHSIVPPSTTSSQFLTLTKQYDIDWVVADAYWKDRLLKTVSPQNQVQYWQHDPRQNTYRHTALFLLELE